MNDSVISGVRYFPLEKSKSNITLFRNSDQVLGRIGIVEYFSINKKTRIDESYLGDLYLTILNGSVRIELEDLREFSPTYSHSLVLNFNSITAQGLLIPEGLSAFLIPKEYTEMIIFCSREE